MLKSMTGFGTVNQQGPGLDIYVEVKTLNSKFLDLMLRIPKELSETEAEIRNVITETLTRGKVMLTIEIARTADAEPKQRYNEELFRRYYASLKSLADSVGADESDLFTLALESPDVIISQHEESLDTSTVNSVMNALRDALSICDKFRSEEGARLSSELEKYVSSIRENLDAIVAIDPSRIKRIKERIRGNISNLVEDAHIDENRLEQELIFYIEKLDITEERVRLYSHLDFFLDTIRSSESTGKKLGFISQEMGREINTIGSKANDAEIQKYVVQMKEELEKIKEQVLNIV